MNLKILVLGIVLLLGGCATTAPTFEQQPTSMVAPEQNWAFDQEAATALADDCEGKMKFNIIPDTKHRLCFMESKQFCHYKH